MMYDFLRLNLTGGAKLFVRRDVQQRRTAPPPVPARTLRVESKSTADRSSAHRFEGTVRAAAPTATARRGRDEAPDYSRDLSDEEQVDGDDLLDIVRLLREREVHRTNAQFAAADELRLQLRSRHRVQCDDQRRTWRVLSAFKPDGTRRLQ